MNNRKWLNFSGARFNIFKGLNLLVLRKFHHNIVSFIKPFFEWKHSTNPLESSGAVTFFPTFSIPLFRSDNIEFSNKPIKYPESIIQPPFSFSSSFAFLSMLYSACIFESKARTFSSINLILLSGLKKAYLHSNLLLLLLSHRQFICVFFIIINLTNMFELPITLMNYLSKRTESGEIFENYFKVIMCNCNLLSNVCHIL